MLTKNPKSRLVAYVGGVIALLVLVVLLARGIIDKQTALSLYDGLEIVLAGFGVSVAGLAAKVLGKQLGNNTLILSGSMADQAVAAAQATAENAVASAQRAVSDATDLQRVHDAITGVLTEVTPMVSKVSAVEAVQAAVARLRAK